MTAIRKALIAGTAGIVLGAFSPAFADVNVQLGAKHYDHIGTYYGDHHGTFTHGPSLSITVGEPLPEKHSIYALPKGLHTHVPNHARYGYYSTGDHLYVVRRDDRHVVKWIVR